MGRNPCSFISICGTVMYDGGLTKPVLPWGPFFIAQYRYTFTLQGSRRMRIFFNSLEKLIPKSF